MDIGKGALSSEGAEKERLTGKRQLFELIVFLFLIVPSMALSFFAAEEGDIGFVIVAVGTILRDIALVLLIFYFLWRNRESLGLIGWRTEHIWTEVGLGVLLFLPVSMSASWLEMLLLKFGLKSPQGPPAWITNAGELTIATLGFFLASVVAISEETIFRGYLIHRFRRFVGKGWAVFFSTLIFMLGHGYEGSAGLVTVGYLGLMFAVIYVWRGSLAAPMVMHFLQNFLGIVVFPYLE